MERLSLQGGRHAVVAVMKDLIQIFEDPFSSDLTSLGYI